LSSDDCCRDARGCAESVAAHRPQVIWGGNAVRPKTGDRVNFWGSQWDRQVTGGDYAANASFKGYASSAASPLVSCQPAAHADGKCWSSKPGNSFPPATLERYISVIVATSIVKNGGSIDGNIASTVVVRVDPNPAYGNDPGKPGYGTIVGVIDDGARLFASAAMVPAADATYFFRHLAVPRHTPVAHLASAMLGDDELRSLTSMAWNELALSIETLAHTSVLTPAPLSVPAGSRRYSFYTPEMNLLAETSLVATGTPPIAYEYVWFNGHPVAQFDVATSTTHWTFTDHLGTPILQTGAAAQTGWRAEYEPFGAVYALRSADQHQPLRLPGQEAEQLNLGANGVTEREYNIFRWYRAGWGRYTQADPIGLQGGANLYGYALETPLVATDASGLKTCVIFTRDTFFGVPYTSHTALWSDGQCKGGSRCSTSEPYLYDPAGSYRARESGSAGILAGEDASLADYVRYQQHTGSKVEVYCFDTSCCDQQQISDRANQIGDPRGFSCAASVSTCISGVGPFRDVSPTRTPGSCRTQVLNARQRKRHGASGGW